MDLNLTYLHFFAFTSMTCQLDALLNLNFRLIQIFEVGTDNKIRCLILLCAMQEWTVILKYRNSLPTK